MLAPVMPWYENPVFLTPIFGFVGVIVGGLITACSSYLLDRRRQIREEAKENTVRSANVTTAARLIELELRHGAEYLQMVLENKCWSTFLKQAPSLDNWEKYCAFLAPEVSQDEWTTLIVAHRRMVQLNYWIERARQRENKAMSDAQVTRMREGFLEPIEKAQQALSRLGGGIIIGADADGSSQGVET